MSNNKNNSSKEELAKLREWHVEDSGNSTKDDEVRAYSIFRKLGLRHLVVLERDGRVCGMITRKDLMLYKLVEHHQRELDLIKRLQQKVRAKQARNGFVPSDSWNGSTNKTQYV